MHLSINKSDLWRALFYLFNHLYVTATSSVLPVCHYHPLPLYPIMVFPSYPWLLRDTPPCSNSLRDELIYRMAVGNFIKSSNAVFRAETFEKIILFSNVISILDYI